MKIKVLLVAALALVATSRGTLDADAIDAVTSSAPGGETEKPASQAEKRASQRETNDAEALSDGD